jgi:hypothetical protein
MMIDRFPKLFCRFVASVANNEIDESFGSGSRFGYDSARGTADLRVAPIFDCSVGDLFNPRFNPFNT